MGPDGPAWEECHDWLVDISGWDNDRIVDRADLGSPDSLR